MKRSSLILSLLVGMVALLTFSLGTSIAWYVSSRNLEIEEIEIKTKSTRLLKISTSSDLSSFQDELTSKDLNEVNRFIPVTSMYSSRWLEKKADNPQFLASYPDLVKPDGEPYEPNIATSGYYSQTLYLLSDDDVYVTLDPELCSFLPDKDTNQKYAESLEDLYPDKSVDEIASSLDDLVKALRVSILNPSEKDYAYAILDPYKEGDTLFGGRLDVGRDGYYDYYTKDNEEYEVIYGDVKNKDLAVYEEKQSEDTPVTENLSSFNASTKANVHALNLDSSLRNGMEITKEDSLEMSDLGSQKSKLLIPVYRNTPTPIVLSIYLEGWDKDCINDTMGASFTMSLGFMIAREM